MNISAHQSYLFIFFTKLHIMTFDKQADVIDAFNTTSRHFDNILNINNVNFDNMVLFCQNL